MSLRRFMRVEGGVQDLEFQLKPKSMVFEARVVHCFALYLEKGAQVIGSFHSGNKHSPKDTLYRFKNPEASRFRIKNIGHATYTWNLYGVNPGNAIEEFEDSVSFDLKRTIQLYKSELLEREREIHTTLREKNVSRKLILETWGRTKREMRTNRPLLKCIFPKLGVHLEFQLDISNSLDIQLREQEENGHQLKRSRSETGEIRSRIPSEAFPKLKGTSGLVPKDQEVSKLLQDAKAKLAKSKSPQADHKAGPEASQKKAEEEPRQAELTHQDYRAVVLVINPSGEGINAGWEDNEQERAELEDGEANGNNLEVGPAKRFSLLSDIIERSHEESSTAGRDKISSDHFNRKDCVLEAESRVGPRNIVSVESPKLNKFKTLPHDNYETMLASKNTNKVDLRRAQTAEKVRQQIDEESESFIENSDLKLSKLEQDVKSPEEVKLAATSGDPYAKYIIIIAFIVILSILGQEWIFPCRGNKCKAIKEKAKQPKPAVASKLERQLKEAKLEKGKEAAPSKDERRGRRRQ